MSTENSNTDNAGRADDQPVIRSVADFALRIATVLQNSRSSTALFFVQQAYPDDIDGLEQMSSDDLLTSVKNNAAVLLKHCG
jgi:hypothetical protein